MDRGWIAIISMLVTGFFSAGAAAQTLADAPSGGFDIPTCGCTDCLWEDRPLCENISIFAGLEGSKQPQDFGINAHFGGRTAVNIGLPLVPEWGLGVQVGTAINATANAVQVVERVEGSTGRTQSFTTVGVFQRFDCGIVWGAASDWLYQDYYDNFFLGQSRARVGYALSLADEVGVQVSINGWSDTGNFGATAVRLDPLTQGHLYWRHTFASGARLGGWLGISEGHGEANAALGDLPPLGPQFLFGSDLFIPLNDRLALFGEANFIQPADTGTVDAYLGLEWRPWGGAMAATRSRYAPLMPVANNTSFAVDLRRQ